MRPDDICIVASGWSAAAIDLRKLPGFVIAVNESAVLIPCDVAVSMDRLWTTHRWAKLTARGKSTWIRGAALKGIENVGDHGARHSWLTVFDNDHKSTTFSEATNRLNGTNSGFCALNLAYHLRPARIFLFGFDMNRSPDGRSYWHPPHEWAPQGATKPGKYAEWAKEFDDAAKKFHEIGASVTNVSATSAISAFAKIAPKQFEAML